MSDANNEQKVFEKITDWSEEFQPRMKERILMRDDFGRLCRQGQGPAGYSSASTGRHHFCPFGIAQRNMATMVCADLDKPGTGPEYMSSAKIRTLSGTTLHEAVYVPVHVLLCGSGVPLIGSRLTMFGFPIVTGLELATML